MISKKYLLVIGVFGFAIFFVATAQNLLSSLASPLQNSSPNSNINPLGALIPPSQWSKIVRNCGVNISGAEFGEKSLPGKLNTDYLYHSNAGDYSYFAKRGQKIVRIPFRWERIQRQSLGSLSKDDLQGLKNMVAAAKKNNQKVILDLHNFGYYYGKPLTVSQANQLADVWKKLAEQFKNEPAIFGYELMNEPHDLPEGGDGWAKISQITVDAIRTVDKKTTILIPGYGWQSAKSWTKENPNLNISDPSNNILYAAHQYFDTDHTGTYSKPFDPKVNTAQNSNNESNVFINWLEKNNKRGIFTEYGVPGNDTRWLSIMDSFMHNALINDRVVGLIYWSAGPWWGPYQLSVQPVNGKDRPQMAILKAHCF